VEYASNQLVQLAVIDGQLTQVVQMAETVRMQKATHQTTQQKKETNIRF
jgi:competence protein ComGF